LTDRGSPPAAHPPPPHSSSDVRCRHRVRMSAAGRTDCYDRPDYSLVGREIEIRQIGPSQPRVRGAHASMIVTSHTRCDGRGAGTRAVHMGHLPTVRVTSQSHRL